MSTTRCTPPGYVLVMKCCQSSAGYGEFFSEEQARREARRYRSKGLSKASRWVVDAVRERGIEGGTVLEPGGGIGAVEIELLKAGAARSTVVELSPGYEQVAAELAREAGVAERMERRVGDFAADGTEPADVVVLHRVVCCYPDYERLLGAAAEKARQTRRLHVSAAQRRLARRARAREPLAAAARLGVPDVRAPTRAHGGGRAPRRLRALRTPSRRHLARHRAGAR